MGIYRPFLRYLRFVVLLSVFHGRADEIPTIEEIRVRMDSIGIRSVRSSDGHLVVSGPDSFKNALLLKMAKEIRAQVESLVGMPLSFESRSVRVLVMQDADPTDVIRVEHVHFDGIRIHRVLLPDYAHGDTESGREALCEAFLSLYIHPRHPGGFSVFSFAIPSWLRRGVPLVLAEQGRSDTYEQAIRLWREGRLLSPVRIVLEPAVLDAEDDHARMKTACGAFVLWLTDAEVGTARARSLFDRLSNGDKADGEWLREQQAGDRGSDEWWDRWMLSQRHVVRALGRLTLVHLDALLEEWRIHPGDCGVPPDIELPSAADCTALLSYRDQPWFRRAVREKRYRIEMLAQGRPVEFRELVDVYAGILAAIESGLSHSVVVGMAVAARKQAQGLYGAVKQAGGVWSEGVGDAKKEAEMDSVVFGAGCFWCVEAAFRIADGVTDVRVGYTGGVVDNPTYKAVCTGGTGHAEVAKVVFDPRRITIEQLMEIFLVVHDPTSLNAQGGDVGTQYRSAVFVHSDQQRDAVKTLLAKAQMQYTKPIVTEVSALGGFYEAEDYHQRYFENNPEAGYCRAVVAPKVQKVRKLLQE